MQIEEIKNPAFGRARNGYDAEDVDRYVREVYETCIRLASSKQALSEKFNAVQASINEYNANKEALTELLLETRTNAQKRISEAEEKAQKILNEAHEKEQELLDNAENVLEKAKATADSEYDEIIAKANLKATELIEEATKKATAIVAEANEDAQKTKEHSNKIIDETNDTISDINRKVEGMKSISATVFAEITKLLNSIDLPSDFSIED